MALLSPIIVLATGKNNTPVDTLKGKDGNLYVITKDAKGEVAGILVVKKGSNNKVFMAPKDQTAPVRRQNAMRDESIIFDVVEKMPTFPGGQVAMMDFLVKNMKYPADAAKNKVQGRVMVNFIVSKDGSLKDFNVVRSVYPSLDQEAMRVVKAMPKWSPGTQNGEPVNVRFTLPIFFKLN